MDKIVAMIFAGIISTDENIEVMPGLRLEYCTHKKEVKSWGVFLVKIHDNPLLSTVAGTLVIEKRRDDFSLTLMDCYEFLDMLGKFNREGRLIGVNYIEAA
jgi:hypothetical protein